MAAFLRSSRECRTILVEKTDRLYRNFEDAVLLGTLGVDIHFVKEGTIYNRKTKSSEKLQHDLKLVIAKNYIDNLSEETRKGLMEKARQGLWPTVAPLGYLNDRDSETIIPDPVRAPLIRRLFEDYATGRYSFKDLVGRAWDMGLRTKKGNRVPKSAIAATIQKTIYYGEFEWNGERFLGKHEPIISRELYLEANRRRLALSHSTAQHVYHPFKGLVRCGRCGCLVTAETKKGKYTYYHCTHARGECDERAVREEDLAAMLGEPLKSLRLDESRVRWILGHIRQDDEKSRQRRTAARRKLEGERADIERRLDLIYEDKLAGTITESFWKRKHDECMDRLGWIDGELARGDGNEGGDLASVERILELTQKAYSLYLAQNPDEQRKMADLLLYNSTLKDRKVRVELRHPFDLIADGANEDREKVRRGESILAQNGNWLRGWDDKVENEPRRDRGRNHQ